MIALLDGTMSENSIADQNSSPTKCDDSENNESSEDEGKKAIHQSLDNNLKYIVVGS